MSLSNTLAGDHMTCDTPQSDRAKLWRRSTGRGGEHWRRYPATIFLARAKLWRRSTGRGGEHWRRYPATIFLARAKLWRRSTDEAVNIGDDTLRLFFLARAKLWRRSTDVGPESSVSKSVSSWRSLAKVSRTRTRHGKLRSSSQPRRRPAQLRGWQLTSRALNLKFRGFSARPVLSKTCLSAVARKTPSV